MTNQSTDSPGPLDVPSQNSTEHVKYDFVISQRGVDIVAVGATCLVETLADGNIIKSPYPAKYHNPGAELALEAQIYERIGPHERLVPIISWDPAEEELVMKRMTNGTLKDYLAAHPEAQPDQRLRWAREAAEGLELVHSAGVVHYDVGPHNFLLDEKLSLKISDFGGSSLDGSRPEVCAGTRYAPPDDAWCRGWRPSPVGDLFGLGSTIYYIATGNPPFWDVESDEVETRFEKEVFPDVAGILCGKVAEKCWKGKFKSASEVLSALKAVDIKAVDIKGLSGARNA